MTNFFGVMQGRLLPKFKGNFQAHPVGYWQDEFQIASEIGFDCIEFIFDYYKSESNPLLIDTQLDRILLLSKTNNVSVKSICADYFMKSPIFLDDKKINSKNKIILKRLIKNANFLGVTDVIIPLVDNSSILNDDYNQQKASSFLKEVINETELHNVNICLETDLPPRKFLKFVENLKNSKIKINYDTGNSVSLGYKFKEELDLYGHLISNIHIKDRVLGGASVPLGTGDCDFKNFFEYLSKKDYGGLFILQAYRNDDALSSLKPQYNFIRECMGEYLYKNK